MADPLHIAKLLGGGWRNLEFRPFREGIEISWLKTGEPGIAILRYQPGASAPLHLHPDMEMILVLDGAQSDENGTYHAGDLVLNPKGSKHSVWSDTGCVVLLHWSKPVVFL
ncbi:MAG: cupin domain-containing protein [Pseudomonadota bacterium]